MDEETFNEAISRLKKLPQDEAPANIEQNVWRQIRLKESIEPEESLGIVEMVHRLLFVSGWSVPAAALAIVFSALISSVAVANSDSFQDKASHALGFDSITEAPGLLLDGFKK